MGHVLWLFWVYGGYFLSVATSGFFLYRLCAPFVRPRKGRVWNALLFLNLMGASGMVIWIGDPNLLYTLPVYFALFLLATRDGWRCASSSSAWRCLCVLFWTPMCSFSTTMAFTTCTMW